MQNKLCLGTVQFGMKYGVKNELGRQPTQSECFAILEEAVSAGIQYFDTASAYGEAEYILGEFGLYRRPVHIISKPPPNTTAAHILEDIQNTLERLHTSYIDGYILHRAEEFYQKDILQALQEAKSRGWIAHIGVSVYEPEDAVAVVSDRSIDYIQIPYNVFDQRLDNTNFFELADKNDITVFARSLFLQGLLLMEEEQIPAQIDAAKRGIARFRAIAETYGYTRLEAAFLFGYCHPGIDFVVFGVDTVEQLRKNIEISKKGMVFQRCYAALKGQFSDMNRKIVTPSLWMH